MIDVLLKARRPADALPVGRRVAGLVRERAGRLPGEPDQANKHLWSSVRTYLTLWDLGRPLEAEADLREAIASGTSAVAANPANATNYATLAGGMSYLATLLEASGRPAEAIEVYDRITAMLARWGNTVSNSIDPGAYRRYCLRATAGLLPKLGRPAEAARRLEALLTISAEEDRPALTIKLAENLLASGDFDKAREAAERAAESPKYAEQARTLIEQIDAEADETLSSN